ncbi:MAG: hypothetical protein ACO3NK_03915, partial [Prochlorotrichaceae cyanobacterium]
GKRHPEALATLEFRAALVPGVLEELASLAPAHSWQWQPPHRLVWQTPEAGELEVLCYSDRFNDILHECTLVVGMAGLAVDQAVALGKPVLQIPGEGPQFTYRFAEAQNRLLGVSAQTIGTATADDPILQAAADCLWKTVNDRPYLAQAASNGKERLGSLGGSYRMAEAIVAQLNQQHQQQKS